MAPSLTQDYLYCKYLKPIAHLNMFLDIHCGSIGFKYLQYWKQIKHLTHCGVLVYIIYNPYLKITLENVQMAGVWEDSC